MCPYRRHMSVQLTIYNKIKMSDADKIFNEFSRKSRNANFS